MALPNSVDPTSPANTDSPAQGALQIRNLKQYIIDVFGVPNATNVTAASMSVTAGGLVTISQSPLTVPTLLQGTASQWLRIGSPYSGMSFEVNTATMLAITATGMLQQTPYYEWVSGVTGAIGTQGAQPLLLRTNTQNRWQINASGILSPIPSTLDLGTVGGPNPRNIYVASNLVAGGHVQGSNAYFTDLYASGTKLTSGGQLDLTQGTVSGQTQGDVFIRSTSTWTRLAAGASGQFLTSQGTTNDPAWVNRSGTGVQVGDNPVAWTGGHTWSSPTHLLTSASVQLGVGTSSPTAMLHVAGSAYVASNIYLAGVALSMPTGSILMYGASTAPTGWLLCDGSAVSRTTYAALFAAISTSYGTGDGSTTFNVPDMRSRLPVGLGQGSGLTNRALAATGGAEAFTPSGTNSAPTFTGNALGTHQHQLPMIDDTTDGLIVPNTAGAGTWLFGTGGSYTLTGTAPTGWTHATAPTSTSSFPVPLSSQTSAGTPAGTVSTPSFTGSSGNSMNPFLCVNFIIKT